jgi:hypothetical protein
LVLREAAAKSFVSRRCSNFNFSRPHKPLRRAAFQQPMNRDLGQGYPVGIFLAYTICRGAPPWPRRCPDTPCAVQYLICYPYRCKSGWFRLGYEKYFSAEAIRPRALACAGSRTAVPYATPDFRSRLGGVGKLGWDKVAITATASISPARVLFHAFNKQEAEGQGG